MANSALRTKAKRKAVVEENGISSKRKKLHASNEKTESCKRAHIDENSTAVINFQSKIMEKLEEELKCNICTEVLIKPSVLNCTHLFCEFCIAKWKKQQERCPICRERITTQTRVLALDVFLEKTLEILAPEQSKARKEIISKRDRKNQKPRRSPRLRNRSRSQSEIATQEALEESLHLRALIDEVLHLANHFTFEESD